MSTSKQSGAQALTALMLTLGLGICAGDANAVDVARKDKQGAAGLCQGALPQFAGTLRARPLAIGNEGSGNAFVTCSIQGDDSAVTRGASLIEIRVGNASADSQTINCTLVNGQQTGATIEATYTAKSIVLAANSGGLLQWLPSDITPAPASIDRPQLSCVLPAGTTLNYVNRYYSENIGS